MILFFGDPEGDDEDTDPYDADGRVDLGDQLRHSKDVHSAVDDLLIVSQATTTLTRFWIPYLSMDLIP